MPWLLTRTRTGTANYEFVCFFLVWRAAVTSDASSLLKQTFLPTINRSFGKIVFVWYIGIFHYTCYQKPCFQCNVSHPWVGITHGGYHAVLLSLLYKILEKAFYSTLTVRYRSFKRNHIHQLIKVVLVLKKVYHSLVRYFFSLTFFLLLILF